MCMGELGGACPQILGILSFEAYDSSEHELLKRNIAEPFLHRGAVGSKPRITWKVAKLVCCIIIMHAALAKPSTKLERDRIRDQTGHQNQAHLFDRASLGFAQITVPSGRKNPWRACLPSKK